MEGIYATGGIILWGCTFDGVYIPCIYSHDRWSYRRWFRFLLLCPLSVERYYFPSSVDFSQQSLNLPLDSLILRPVYFVFYQTGASKCWFFTSRPHHTENSGKEESWVLSHGIDFDWCIVLSIVDLEKRLCHRKHYCGSTQSAFIFPEQSGVVCSSVSDMICDNSCCWTTGAVQSNCLLNRSRGSLFWK